MDQNLLHILHEYRQEILSQWEERVYIILPNWEKDRVHRLVEYLMNLLECYLKDPDVEIVLEHVEKIINAFFLSLSEAPKQIVDPLLVSRYVMLSVMAHTSGKEMNSLETFGQINDIFDPLIRTISVHFKAKSKSKIEKLPRDYTRASQIGLLTLDFAGIGLFMLDKHLNFIHWTDGLERIFGIKAVQVLGKNIVQSFPDLQKERKLFSTIEKAMNDNREFALFEVKHKHVSDKELIVNYKIAPLRDEYRHVIGVSVLCHDITEHRKGQLALKRYEQYFENILNDAADALIILNENDRIVMWNRAAENIYGWEEEEVIGKSISLIVPDDLKSQHEIEKINAIVRNKGFLKNFRTQRLTRDGRKIVIEVTRTAILNERNDYIGSSVIARDMTQQEQLRQQLIQSEKLSAVGTLAAGIAHEVGSPLNSISSLTQLLSFQIDNPEFKEKVSLIQQNIDRISRTVKTLVDFSRPIHHKIEDIYINHVIEQVIRIIKYDKRLKHQTIQTELEAKIPLVTASFDQLLQVLINICLNAADAMENQKDGALLIKSWNDQSMVFVSVTDNGSGIEEKDQAHIFEPFYSTKDKGKGTGLGLWVSYNIMTSFLGNITVDSRVGEFTTFTISLPIAIREE